MKSLIVEKEIYLLQKLHEHTTEYHNFAPTMLVAYREGKRRGVIWCRDIIDDDDKHIAYQEMSSLIASFKADEIFFASDAWITPFADKVDSLQLEALIIYYLKKDNIDSRMITMPYFKAHNKKIYYLESEMFSLDTEVAEGPVSEIFKRAFAMEQSPLGITENAEALSTLGHSLSIYPATGMGDPQDFFPPGREDLQRCGHFK